MPEYTCFNNSNECDYHRLFDLGCQNSQHVEIVLTRSVSGCSVAGHVHKQSKDPVNRRPPTSHNTSFPGDWCAEIRAMEVAQLPLKVQAKNCKSCTTASPSRVEFPTSQGEKNCAEAITLRGWKKRRASKLPNTTQPPDFSERCK